MNFLVKLAEAAELSITGAPIGVPFVCSNWMVPVGFGPGFGPCGLVTVAESVTSSPTVDGFGTVLNAGCVTALVAEIIWVADAVL